MKSLHVVQFLLLLEQFRVDIVCETRLENTCQKRERHLWVYRLMP